jgi:hypothetical protein
MLAHWNTTESTRVARFLRCQAKTCCSDASSLLIEKGLMQNGAQGSWNLVRHSATFTVKVAGAGWSALQPCIAQVKAKMHACCSEFILAMQLQLRHPQTWGEELNKTLRRKRVYGNTHTHTQHRSSIDFLIVSDHARARLNSIKTLRRVYGAEFTETHTHRSSTDFLIVSERARAKDTVHRSRRRLFMDCAPTRGNRTQEGTMQAAPSFYAVLNRTRTVAVFMRDTLVNNVPGKPARCATVGVLGHGQSQPCFVCQQASKCRIAELPARCGMDWGGAAVRTCDGGPPSVVTTENHAKPRNDVFVLSEGTLAMAAFLFLRKTARVPP